MSKRKHLIVLSSPSGGGKSTVSRYLLANFNNLSFSVSATTRKMRPNEIEGVDYYFFSQSKFEEMISNNKLVEYEKIFGNYYGTLRSEIEKALKENKCLLFDIDVKGALSIKEKYPHDSVLIFLSPPSIEELEKRLRHRATENNEEIKKRLNRAELEMKYRQEFDFDIINVNLNDTLKSVHKIVEKNCPDK